MKRLAFFLIILSLTFIFTSCEKFESQIKGKITYISLEDSLEYAAINAVLEKYKIEDDREEKISTVSADSNGLFVFDYITLGDWKIKAQFTKDSFLYIGYSDIIHTSGEDVKEVNIVLDSVCIITNE